MEKIGIKEFLEILEFGFSIGEGFVKSYKDKELTLTDSANFFPSIMLIPSAFQGIDQIPMELKDIDIEEALQIKNYVLGKCSNVLGIEEKWMLIAQEAYSIGLSVMKIIKLIS